MSDRTEQIVIRITRPMARRLDAMMERGGYRHRTALVRSLLLAIINDDAKAHGEKPLDEQA